jgi:hypothetical protein
MRTCKIPGDLTFARMFHSARVITHLFLSLQRVVAILNKEGAIYRPAQKRHLKEPRKGEEREESVFTKRFHFC